MAREESMSRLALRRSRTRVPVAHRTEEEASGNNGRSIRRRMWGKRSGGGHRPDKLGLAGYMALAVVSLLFFLGLARPLNNYYDGRAEITQLTESIAAKTAEKERVLAEIEKYQSESYIEQEARRRLGVVAPGETAYRIVDPAMAYSSQVTTDVSQEDENKQWYALLWDSVANPPLDTTNMTQ